MGRDGLSRRTLLSLGAAWAVSGAAGVAPSFADIAEAGRRERRRAARRNGRRRKKAPPVPRVNGAINIQPIRRFGPEQEPKNVDIIPRIIDLQMRALYELGFDSIRLTLSFAELGFNLLGAIPYVRAARALGIDVCGIVGQFGFFHDLANVLADPERRRRVLDGYLTLYASPVAPAARKIERTGEVSLQILNEPTNFLGIPPVDYVRRFLLPSYEHLKSVAPGLTVLSAAPVGEKIGVRRAYDMLGADLEDACDVVGLHVYDREVIPELAGLTSKPVWITETGAVGPEHHLGWVREVYPEIRRGLPHVQRIFFFELFDLAPRAFRILDLAEREDGSITSEVESTALYDELVANVERAAGAGPRARYEELVPDITAYLPTAEDAELVFELLET